MSGLWREVGTIGEIPAAGSRVVRTDAGDVAIFRTAEGAVYAIEDSCPHKAGPLSQGIVHGDKVTCPLHNWVIDLATGGVIGPDEGCVRTLPLRLEGERILLDFSVLVRRAA
jgi:nitrite reductase (NADH) small subunit